MKALRRILLISALPLLTASLGAGESLQGTLYCPWVTCWITCEPGNPNAPGYVTHVGTIQECCSYVDSTGCYSSGTYSCADGAISDCWSQPQ